MGMFPGTNFGTKTDEITIVVAHWDTVLDSPGFDDNGSGTVYILGQYLIDVLCRQQIKLFQFVSTSEFHEY